MIEPTFQGEPTEEQKMMEAVAAKCKCGRCTRTGEKVIPSRLHLTSVRNRKHLLETKDGRASQVNAC